MSKEIIIDSKQPLEHEKHFKENKFSAGMLKRVDKVYAVLRVLTMVITPTVYGIYCFGNPDLEVDAEEN
jgi:hypothetical protein